ncbi:hypothetical protein D3C73_1404560 [compost metagenome]
MYTWIDLQNERGLQKIHAVEFNPQQGNLELRAGTKDGKVYGMKGVTEMAMYADSPGNRVIAGINGDFYEIPVLLRVFPMDFKLTPRVVYL